MSNVDFVAVVGPTACGKTTRGVSLARALNGEIISADSRQVYQHMDIGTGKDIEEYADIPYHLIDIAPAGYKYNLYEYLTDANNAIDEVKSRNRLPIVVGGTGLYVESLIRGIVLPEVPENKSLREELSSKSLTELAEILASMKQLHNVTDIDTKARAIRAIEIETFYAANPQAASAAHKGQPKNVVVIGIDIPRDARRSRITQRLQQRLDSGMVDEVRQLLNSGIAPEDLIYYGLEYKFLTQHVIGELSYDEMFSLLEIAIHQFAKRQMTWFRGMEKRGIPINWLAYDMPETEFISSVKKMLAKEEL